MAAPSRGLPVWGRFQFPRAHGPLGGAVLCRQRPAAQENNFSGNVTLQTGWQWRGQSGHLLRLGLQYFNGMSDEMQFFNRFEQQIGGGLWYDF